MSVEMKAASADYVIGGDGVAVLHGVRMVPFHMNMPALCRWEKGSVEDVGKKFLEKVIQAKEWSRR